jgi:hypothetical protein
MNGVINGLRRALIATDFERPHGPDYEEHRRWSGCYNSLAMKLEALNAIPGISIASGTVTMAFGVLKILAGIFPNPDASEEKSMILGQSGLKSLALGAAAVFLPGFGHTLNAMAAVKDALDAVNMSVPLPPAEEDEA